MGHRRSFAPALAILVTSLVLLGGTTVRGQDWSPERAARYLDERMDRWFAWKPAASPEGPCVSCHTAMPYLLARPPLRHRLGEPHPTRFERGLLDRLRANVGAKPPSYLQGVEVVFAAFFLSAPSADASVTPQARAAFDQLWAIQATDGSSQGAWEWLTVDLDPWEHAESAYFGAALAALAVGRTGMRDALGPAASAHIAALRGHLARPSPTRPLHDTLARVWASSTNPEVMSTTEREAVIADVFSRQQPDGGWTSASLGPWTAHPRQPVDVGSNAYATGYVAYVLQQAGIRLTDARLARAVAWLAARQDRVTGAWPSVSMNKPYPPGSMESFFMQDAATAFASLALLEAGK